MNMGSLTGLVAVILIFGMPIIIVAILRTMRSRDNAELQKTLRMSIEKGQALPPEFLDSLKSGVPKPKNPMNDIRAGIILIGLALGLVVLDYAKNGYIVGHLSGVAAIPGFIGLALLILGIIGNGKTR